MADGMEFGRLSKVTLGETATTIATEGGSVIAGLFGASILGKQVEKYVGTAGSKAVVPTSKMTDKVIAYVANNGPKVAAWYLLKREGKILGSLEKDIEKGIVASIVLDTVVRAGNSFAPKSLLTIAGFDVLGGVGTNPQLQTNLQQVIQENSALRGQLNQALTKLASASIAQPPQPHDTRFGMMQTTSEAEDRRKNYGAMTPPIEDERNRRFGTMNKAKLNFAGEGESVASAFGML
jgi:hypothetical protein